MMQRPYAIIEAPSVLGLKPTGVDRLARSLLANGLAERVNARYAGRVEPPAYSEANPNGEAASMDLAFTTGYGPALLSDLERRGPLVRLEDTVAFGFRDADEQR